MTYRYSCITFKYTNIIETKILYNKKFKLTNNNTIIKQKYRTKR